MDESPLSRWERAGVRVKPTVHSIRPAANLATILLSALLFLYPAVLNHYPLVFSDTGGFLEQALLPDMGWDKPWVYGPFLTPLHAKRTLWLAAYAQCLILSATLWLTQASLRPPNRIHHITLCAILAAGTAAPWFASLLMPDSLAPIAVLGLYILAANRLSRLTLGATALLTTIAIASHLAHLILAAACLVALAIFDRRSLLRTAPPLAAALLFLLASNWLGHGRLAISPYGANFALARLVADGPARTTIQEACPAAGWHVCAWRDHLPDNADDFLWDPNGPVWANGYGPLRIAPEAAEIVRATVLAHPIPVLVAALANTARQLAMVEVGDTLVPDHLDVAVKPRIQLFFPPPEAMRFTAGRQFNGTLEAPPATLQLALLLAGALATVAIAIRNRHFRPLATLILIALLANAAATGALSGPHHRYQARIAWLVTIAPLLYVLGARATETLAGATPPARPPPPPASDESSAG